MGNILQIQSFSLHDGEGIRTTIFLPGCYLRCKWCANPETWTIKPKLVFYKSKCSGCGKCKNVCHLNICLSKDNFIDKCDVCGKCIDVCTNKALSVLCKKVDIDEIIKKIKRDEIFFRYSNGGVTFSGGEPTFQTDFLRELVFEIDKIGIDMWIETCGYFSWDKTKDIFTYFSHVFLDLKHMNNKKHKELTGVDNQLILDNAINIYKLGIPITIRIPAMKNINITKENIIDTAIFIKKNIPNSDIELLPYHSLGNEKYKALQLEKYLFEFETPTELELKEAENIFLNYNIKVVSYK